MGEPYHNSVKGEKTEALRCRQLRDGWLLAESELRQPISNMPTQAC